MTVDVDQEAQLPLDSAGALLARAREAAGLSRAQVAARTRIPERHLKAIELGDFSALPARAYAVGFSRSYARAVGADEAAIVAAVREELVGIAHEPQHRGIPDFEPGDPTRVPSSRLAWIAALLALVVVIGGATYAWRSWFMPAGTLPSLLPAETPAPPPSTAPQPTPAAATVGPVVFTATQPKIWVKFYDGAGQQLFQKELALGESWTVPADLPDVKLWTARPEALAITVGGQPVPPLSTVQQMLKDVPVTAAALLSRGAQPVPANTAGPVVPAPQPRPVAAAPRRSAPAQVAPAPATAISPSPAAAGPASSASAAPAAPADR